MEYECCFLHSLEDQISQKGMFLICFLKILCFTAGFAKKSFLRGAMLSRVGALHE